MCGGGGEKRKEREGCSRLMELAKDPVTGNRHNVRIDPHRGQATESVCQNNESSSYS